MAHDGILRLLLCHLLGVPVYRRFDFRLSFAGWSEITRGPHDARWTVVRFNQEDTAELATGSGKSQLSYL